MAIAADITSWRERFRQANEEMLTRGEDDDGGTAGEGLRGVVAGFPGTFEELLEAARGVVGDSRLTMGMAMLLDSSRKGRAGEWYAVGEEWLMLGADVKLMDRVAGEIRRVVGAIVEHSVSSPRGDLVPAYLRSLMERYAQQLPAYLTVVHCEVVNVCVRAGELAVARWVAQHSCNVAACGRGVSEVDYRKWWYEVALSYAPVRVDLAISASRRAFEPIVDKRDKHAWVLCVRALHLYVVLRMVEMGGSLDPLVSTASASVFPHGSPLHMRKYVDGMFIGGRGEGNIREGEMLLGADSARGSSSGGIEDVRTVIGKLIMMGMATDESRERQVGAHSETLDERARRSLDSEGLLSLVESQLLPLMENRKALSKMREISEVFSHVPLERVIGVLGLPRNQQGVEQVGVLVDLFNNCRRLCGGVELRLVDGFMVFNKKAPVGVDMNRMSECMEVAMNSVCVSRCSRVGIA